jgi:hypothetical protein
MRKCILTSGASIVSKPLHIFNVTIPCGFYQGVMIQWTFIFLEPNQDIEVTKKCSSRKD